VVRDPAAAVFLLCLRTTVFEIAVASADFRGRS
jgi:hypothetical protein